jgi:pyrimidine deaminase RibD-like protein
VDNSAAQLISVQSTDDNTALRIVVDQDRVASQGAEQEAAVGRHADRQALRALLPHERVEFVTAGTG